MKRLSIFPLQHIKIILVVSIALLTYTGNLFSQSKKKSEKEIKDPRNNWSLGFSYGENGFGPFAGYYFQLGNSTDLNLGLSFSGISDSKEIERYDYYGNSIVPYKVNRVYMMPLSIGIRQELFKNDIEGNFLPVLNLGVAPTLVFTNPYDKSFFSALGYTTTHFAAGAYAGIGVSFRQSESIAMSITFDYYYLPVIGEEIQSVSYNTINNVGGLQLSFGVNFLH